MHVIVDKTFNFAKKIEYKNDKQLVIQEIPDGWDSWLNEKKRIQILWDRITGHKLRRIHAYCGGAAVYEVPQYTRDFFLPSVLRLVYCGDATFKYIAAAVHEMQYM